MKTFVTDTASVGTVEAAVFQTLQQGSTNAQWILRNTGGATINYRATANNGSSWDNIGVFGTDTNNTLSVLQTKLIQVTSDYPQIKLMAYAGTPSTLVFSISRTFDRAEGGNIPLLTL